MENMMKKVMKIFVFRGRRPRDVPSPTPFIVIAESRSRAEKALKERQKVLGELVRGDHSGRHHPHFAGYPLLSAAIALEELLAHPERMEVQEFPLSPDLVLFSGESVNDITNLKGRPRTRS